MKAVQRLGQSRRSRAFHGAHPQYAHGPVRLHRAGGFPGQFKQAVRIAQENLSRWRQLEPAPFAHEQRDPQLAFQGLDARRHARLRPMQDVRRAQHASGLHDRSENQ
ncbi:hypothetical protein D3C85_1447170 [compost metagenome]